MSEVRLKFINNVFLKIEAEPSIIMELADNFTFYAPNYKFHPKYKNRIWDGKIRLINTLTAACYSGLAKRIKKFCDTRNYKIEFDEQLLYNNCSEYELQQFINTLHLPEKYKVRDYQFDSMLKCIRSGRRTLISPTSSGKSLMIYCITQWYKNKSLVIVPTIGLVQQMESDFRDYGFKGKIVTSLNKLPKNNNIDCDVVITTWQSLNNGKTKMPKEWYDQFNVVFGDEAHGCKATTLVQILSSMVNCKYRFGTTGTLDGDPLNEATIEGLFGPKYQAVTTKELMHKGFVSNLKIKCIVLRYNESDCDFLKKKSYNEEIDFLTSHKERNKFIVNLTLSLKGNKLLFFRKIDHGKELHDLITSKTTDNVFYIDGAVTDREQIRKAIEEEENATLVASLGTTSTGVSINKLHHMIVGHPSKSKIKVLQSIGRMLRLHEEKNSAILYDIVDNLQHKSRRNFTLDHFSERIKMYASENFDYEIYNVRLK